MQKVILDLIPGGVAPIAYASQYDDGRVIRFMLTYGGPDTRYILSSEVITCNLTKPDGTEIVIDVANPGAGKNYVDLVNGADDYDQEGVYSGEIVLTRSSTVQGTANFILKVEADAYDGQVTTDTATGNPCTFLTDLADNLVSLTAEIVASGGGGTPDNPIPINGYTGGNIVNVSDTTLANYIKGIFNGTHDFVDLGSLTWLESGGNFFCQDAVSNRKTNAYAICGGYTQVAETTPSGLTVDRTFAFQENVITRVSFRDTRYTTAEDFKTAMSGKYLIYELATKITPTITETDFNNIVSSFNANGDLYTIAFGQTVYGGVLDVTKGKLTVTWGSVDLGSLNYSKDTMGDTWRFSATMPNDYRIPDNTQIFDLLCSIFKTGYAPINSAYAEDYQICGYPSDNHLYIKDTDYTDANALKTAMSGILLVYPLATPYDIDLTPVQISALVGTNNITSDLGGDVEVTYIKKV